MTHTHADFHDAELYQKQAEERVQREINNFFFLPNLFKTNDSNGFRLEKKKEKSWVM